jgi:itaconyl-CoA hydratase
MTGSGEPPPGERGWQGRFFEDFTVGDVYYHPLGKTVTEADNHWFTLLTQNTARVHVDGAFAAATEFGRPLVNSTYVLSLVTGQSVIDLTWNVFANLGWDEVRLPAPAFVGDTIHSRSKILHTACSRSRPDVGVVRAATEGYNQDGVIVISFRRTFLVYRRGRAPAHPGLRPPEDSLPATTDPAASGVAPEPGAAGGES